MMALRRLTMHLGVMLLGVVIFFVQGPSFVRHLGDRLALAHRLVGRVGIDLLNPAREAHLHVGKPRFIGLDVSEGANLVLDLPPLDGIRLHPDALNPLRGEREWRQVRFRCS